MKKCSVCWGVFQGEACPFGNGVEHPWVEDYAMMKKGKMVPEEHQRNVARWVLHCASEHTEGVLSWAKLLMQEK